MSKITKVVSRQVFDSRGIPILFLHSKSHDQGTKTNQYENR